MAASRSFLGRLICGMMKGLNSLQAVFAFGTRVWLFKVFFIAGLTKIQSWSSTLALFEYEYTVPYLPFEIAAYAGTAAELILPTLLLLGVTTRFSAIALFIFNYVAVISYPDISIAGVKDHILWGFMMAYLVFHGAGKLSVDRFFAKG